MKTFGLLFTFLVISSFVGFASCTNTATVAEQATSVVKTSRDWTVSFAVDCQDPENPNLLSTRPGCFVSLREKNKTAGTGATVEAGTPNLTSDDDGHNVIWDYFGKYKWLFAVVMFGIGVFLLLWGGVYVKVTIFIFVFMTVVALIWILLYGLILPDSTPEWVGWIVLVASVAAGLFAAFYMMCWMKLGVFLLACWVGGCGGSMLYDAIVSHIVHSTVALWIMVIVCALIVGVISLKLYKQVIVIGSALLGAYMILRAISVVGGGWPNSFTLNDSNDVPWTFYMYLIAFIVLGGFGIWFQVKKHDAIEGNDEQYHGYERV